MQVKKKYILPMIWRFNKWRKASEWQRPDAEDLLDMQQELTRDFHRFKRQNDRTGAAFREGQLDIIKKLLCQYTKEDELTD